MIKNYLKLSFRNLRRHPGYAAIHILGLAIGIACCGLMMLYVHHELSYDAFFEKADRIWRISTEIEGGGQISRKAFMPLPMLKHLEAVPEIQTVVEVGSVQSPYFRHRGEWVRQEGIASAGANMFEVFGYSMLIGNAKTVLEEPNSIVLTRSLALKYFGDENPIGQVLEATDKTYTVKGVMADAPSNTHWPFQALVSMDRSGPLAEMLLNRWGWGYTHTYVLMPETFNVAGLESKLNQIAATEQSDQTYTFHLQRLQDIHLHSQLEGELSSSGNPKLLSVFFTIALFVLLIACINYINLATAQSSKRVREIGVRKVVGAARRHLIVQLLGESLLVAMLAALLALVFIDVLLPIFNSFVDRQISLKTISAIYLYGGLAGLALLVGLIAGSYPAFLVSTYRPAHIFQRKAQLTGNGLFRKSLVIFQFTICIVFIIGACIFYRQYRFMLDKDLGFQQEHILTVSTQQTDFAPQYEVFKQRLLQYSGIKSVTAAMGKPGIWAPVNAFQPDSTQMENSLSYHWLGVDYDFLETLDIELLQGRDLSSMVATDEHDAFLLNESAVRALGLENPIGHELQLNLNDRKGRVIGVMKDFHHGTLREAITPTLIYIVDDVFYSDVIVRVEPGSLADVLTSIENVWKEIYPALPFEYSFFDDQIGQQYAVEARMGTVAGLVSILTLFVACMGLLGLVMFTVESRTKEIGIRKVLGASITHVVTLLSRDYVKLVAIAFLAAVPIAYYAMQHWLNGFAYRIELEWWIFALAGTLALVIAVATVSYQSIKAALANPVEALRYE